MSISDEEFREEYKPLYVPAHFSDAHNDQDKVIYALAQLGEATADETSKALMKLDNSPDEKQVKNLSASVLGHLFDKGLISAEEINGVQCYNLKKITEANDGAVDPDLLAPGLD